MNIQRKNDEHSKILNHNYLIWIKKPSSFHIPGWQGTHYVVQAGLELIEIFLSLSPEYSNRVMHYKNWLFSNSVLSLLQSITSLDAEEEVFTLLFSGLTLIPEVVLTLTQLWHSCVFYTQGVTSLQSWTMPFYGLLKGDFSILLASFVQLSHELVLLVFLPLLYAALRGLMQVRLSFNSLRHALMGVCWVGCLCILTSSLWRNTCAKRWIMIPALR